jgi:hypothetical protein
MGPRVEPMRPLGNALAGFTGGCASGPEGDRRIDSLPRAHSRANPHQRNWSFQECLGGNG